MAILKKKEVFVLELTGAEASALFLSISATTGQGLIEKEIALVQAIEALLADRNEP